MKIGVLAIAQVPQRFLAAAAHGLSEVLPDTTCEVTSTAIAAPEHAYDKKRRQYNSTQILSDIQAYAQDRQEYNRILGIIDADIYVTGLNYVFGEAYIQGKAALISTWRLKPQYYAEEPDRGALELRIVKEAIHEVGHTLGLQHCPRSYCVMHFSNSIFEVDKKQSLFCDQCYLNAAVAINQLEPLT
ncbi:archaemetzincin family Zn-dependent metalloprotease [Candidatus Bathyarchaeota archaeon]|nr:archaemetzincin family Zn-dependent metalloprotease [Candidatus Bathyarchaeota archaeon]